MTSPSADPAEPTRNDRLSQPAAIPCDCGHRAVIEQAKGAVMVTYGLTAEDSFELLRFHSQTGNVKLRAIAAELTALLPTAPTHNEAVHQFDRLIDDVTRSLRTRREPARAAGGGHRG